MPDLIGHLFTRRSTTWTFRTLFPGFFNAKVHLLDLPYNGRDTLPSSCPSCPAPTGISLREGPHSGPSVHFSRHFFTRRSTSWTIRTTEGIPSRLPARHARLRPGISLREGPHSGPSVHFSRFFFARRSTLWTFRTLFPVFFRAKVHALDLQAGDYPS
jgi:hypothetical protein